MQPALTDASRWQSATMALYTRRADLGLTTGDRVSRVETASKRQAEKLFARIMSA